MEAAIIGLVSTNNVHACQCNAIVGLVIKLTSITFFKYSLAHAVNQLLIKLLQRSVVENQSSWKWRLFYLLPIGWPRSLASTRNSLYYHAPCTQLLMNGNLRGAVQEPTTGYAFGNSGAVLKLGAELRRRARACRVRVWSKQCMYNNRIVHPFLMHIPIRLSVGGERLRNGRILQQ